MNRLLVFLVVLTVVGAAGCSTEGEGSSDDVVAVAGTVDLSGTEVEVVLPSGVFTFTITEPRDVVPAEDAGDDAEHEAPEGQAYVGLGWAQSGTAPAFGPILHGTTPQKGTVRVRSGDDVLDALTVDTQKSSGEGAWVLVPEDLADVVAEIAYDGQVQTLDLADAVVEQGAAAGLYDIATLPTDCPDARETGATLRYAIDCTTSAATPTPYVADLGWASEGEGWLVLDLTLQPSGFQWSNGNDSGRFTVEAQRGDLGAAQVLASSDLPADGYAATIAVPAKVGAPTTLSLTRTYDLTRSGSGSGPATSRAEYTASLQLPALPGKDN
ncbi:hypothetical protein [Nocardioides sp. WS12]|uniref:hypothetical protein n=1 Tax=Nocardioides sp. WS12 TaxID=2486272 RepID=UPI0015FCDC5E|nr:hypothetical protein [Nocardioides sp. WS12]